MPVTPAFVKRTITKWTKRLELDPKWKLSIKTAQRCEDMPMEGVVACIAPDSYFQATIHVCATCVTNENADSVIVHELLHIILHPLESAMACPEEHKTHLIESTIERLVPGYLKGLKK